MEQQRAWRLAGAIARRKSVRRYDGQPIAPETWQALVERVAGLDRYTDAPVRVAFVQGTARVQEVFRGVVGNYGRVAGAPAFMAFVAASAVAAGAPLGFLGEEAVLEATALGLGTCWVAGFFRPRVAAELVGTLAPGERVVAVSPLGYAAPESPLRTLAWKAGKALSGTDRPRLPVEEFTQSAVLVALPEEILLALESVRRAPSAYNRQPWRFAVRHGWLYVLPASEWAKAATAGIDCGIAMAHVAVTACAQGLYGAWAPAPGGTPGFARFPLPE